MLISIKPLSWSKFTLKRIKSQLLPISLFLSYIFPSWIRIQFQSLRYKVLKIWALNVKLRYYSNRRSHKTVDFFFFFDAKALAVTKIRVPIFWKNPREKHRKRRLNFRSYRTVPLRTGSKQRLAHKISGLLVSFINLVYH